MATTVLKTEESLPSENVTKNSRFSRGATFNVMHSSEITKVLRELTQCVANEHDLLVPDHHHAVIDHICKTESCIVSRNDISCSELSSSTTTNYSLDAGLDRNQSHICADCGKQFSKRDFLQKHRIVHEEPRHRCIVCEKSFVREDKLKRHFVSIHSKSRPHVCPVCAKAFARKDKLKDHQKHHLTAGSSFMCVECRVPFVQKSDLNRHTRGAHKTAEDGGGGGVAKAVSACGAGCPVGVAVNLPSLPPSSQPPASRARRPQPRRPPRHHQPPATPAPTAVADQALSNGLLTLQPALTALPGVFPHQQQPHHRVPLAPQFPARAPLPLYHAPAPPAPSLFSLAPLDGGAHHHGHHAGLPQLSYCPSLQQHHPSQQPALLPAHLYPYLHF